MSMKNCNDTIGNRTRDLPACSAVPQPTAPPRLDINVSTDLKSGSKEDGAKITRAVYRQTYELEVGGIEFFFWQRQKAFLIIQVVQTSYVTHPAFCSKGILRSFAWSTATGAWC